MPDDDANSALEAAASAAALSDLNGAGGSNAGDPGSGTPERETKLTLRLGDEQFDLLSLNASEGLSQPFLIVIDVLSQLGAFDLMPHLGSEAIVESLRDGEHMRYFHGIVTDGQLVGEATTGTQGWSEGAHHYRLTLRPKAYFHSHGRDFRMFQDMSVLDIITDVLERNHIDYGDNQQERSCASRMLKYCVQFGESDMAFVYRIMEEHGIYYFYRHDKDKHAMVLCDAPGSHAKLTASKLSYHPFASSIANSGSALRGSAVETIPEWHEYLSTGAEMTTTLRDFDFIKPALLLEGVKQGDAEHIDDAVEFYNWPGRFYDNATGKSLAEFLLQSRRAQRQRYEASAGSTALQVGYTFTLNSHPISRYNAEFLIIAMQTVLSTEVYRSGSGGGDTEVHFTAIPAQTTYRAPLFTPRPVAQGPETALVVGPAGEEIYVDSYGRIKVQFHWDRYGKNDDKSSCWVRVSQTGGLGNMIIPRIGHEVLIDFINGNPDRPVVVGRLYNAANMPVYALPEHKTKAVWRSKTYKRINSQAYPDAQPDKIESEHPGANEIRFEDKTGDEELYVHAEKNLNTRVRNDETHFVAKNQTTKVWNDQITEVHKDRTEEVWGDEKITLHQNRVETVTANETVTINGNRSVTISGTETLKVTGDIKVDGDGNIAITAASKITLTCGESSIELTPTGIKINSLDVEVNGQLNAKLTAAAQVTVQASGITTIQGAMVKIN